MEISLHVNNLHKKYGDKVVHRGVTFDLRKGEILALFGGSGSGKSVILRSIIGLEKPDQGEIIFYGNGPGKDLAVLTEEQLFPIRTQIAYVFQNGALFDSLTVEENLAYALKEHTKLSPDEIHAKVNAMLEKIDMKGANHLYPNELSGGMQKRAGLARAIILDPHVILFDEPTAGLDPVNTKRLLANILKLKTHGITGIFVTHDVPAAFEIADRIAILSSGKIAVVDTPENFQSPMYADHEIVQSFISGALGNPD